MSKQMIALLIAAGFGCPALPQSTTGWETVTDTRKICAAKSPQSWEHTSLRPMDNTPGIARVVAQVRRDGSPLLFDFVKTWGGTATHVFEDNPTRYWIEFDGKTGMIADHERPYRFHWFVVIPSKPVCSMHIFFNDPALTEQAKLMAKSLKSTK
ncbi:MAG: hypothetical protein ABSG03_32125 [Bryobacteraceae bacterium]|jgi:hypothetical protein